MDQEFYSKDDLAKLEEELLNVSQEKVAELNAMAAESMERHELMNLVPIDARSEDYISRRYPIAVLYGRADTQELADTYHDTYLTEEEIEKVCDRFHNHFPFEVELAIRDAIEAVLNERIPRNFETTN